MITEKVKQRFWKNIDFMENGCWVWKRPSSNRGYGTIFIDGKNKSVHRFSWELNVGPIPEGMLCCHKCDNTSCVRPSHLFIGTDRDNMHDMIKKGRAYHPVGEESSSCKLTDEQVREIKNHPQYFGCIRKLAARFGVDSSTIRAARNNHTWKHITTE